MFQMNLPVCLTMPKRPPCTGVEQDEVVHVHVIVHSGGHRSLFVRMDSIDWLLAYAADELYYQGISRPPPPGEPAVADKPFIVHWDFDASAWVAEILSGTAKGATQCFSPERLHKSQWYQLLKNPDAAQWLDVKDTRWSNSSFTSRRAAAKEIARLWCIATTQGERGEFEKSQLFNPNATRDREPEADMQGQADMQGPHARSRSPRSASNSRASSNSRSDRARGLLRPRSRGKCGQVGTHRSRGDECQGRAT